jgi:HSP20 family protein
MGMTLNRWDPFRDLLNFQENVNRIIERRFHEDRVTRGACWYPSVDMLETPDSYIFRAELPGVGIENIDIEVRHRRLRLAGVRLMEAEPEIAAYHSIERVHGQFERIFVLPGDVDVDQVKAKYVDGVLEIVLPKSEEKVPRTIAVVSED